MDCQAAITWLVWDKQQMNWAPGGPMQSAGFTLTSLSSLACVPRHFKICRCQV